MNNNNDIVGSTKGTSKLTRARFGPGMLLQHGDLEQLNNYTRDLSRLLFQSFFGCGVVCGLVVDVDRDEECKRLKVTVQRGVALTCSGDPVYVPDVQTVFTRQNLDLDKASGFWVVLCGTTKCCAPRVTTCSSDDDEATSDCTREKDGFEIRLLSIDPDKPPACLCGWPGAPVPSYPPQRLDEAAIQADPCKCVRDPMNDPRHSPHYSGTCGCTCGECSDCDCKCVLLARVYKTRKAQKPWAGDHSVRRFIRPVLMRDPQLEKDIGMLAALYKDEAAAQERAVAKEEAAKPATARGRNTRRKQNP